MNFYTYNSLQLDSKDLLALIKTSAKRYILLKWLSADDNIVDNYLLKNYKISLKAACLKIISSIKISSSQNSPQVRVYISDNNLDKLAQLITYGNGTFFGSKILKNAIK